MRCQRFPFLALLVVTTFCTVRPLAAAQPAPADTPQVHQKVRQLMQDHSYAEVLPAIEEAAAADGAPKDYLQYLKGRTLYLQKQYDEAVTAFEQIEKQFADGPWARRARFAKAVALVRKGDFRGAELIYRAEAEYLLSANRKQEIADIYLEFADAYFKPPEKEQKPDYEKAMQFFAKALEVGPKPEKRTQVELLLGQCYQELGKTSEAVRRYQRFIRNHADHPLEVEARYRLGECRLAEGNRRQARRVWQDLLAKHTQAKSPRIAEATYRLSRTWRIPKPESDEELALGTAALERFVERFAAHELAGRAHLEIALSYVHRGRYEDAVGSLGPFIADERYRDREEIPAARDLLGRSYQLQKKFPEALAVWREYLAKHPTHKQWSQVQRQVIHTEYLIAAEKYKAEQYDDARKLFSEFLVKYPLDARNPDILLLFGDINYRQEQWEAAIADWRRLLSKYPQSEQASGGRLMIAAVLEQKLGRLEEALQEYRKVTGDYRNRALQAADRLTAKSLMVATERVFRCDEVPGLKLTTRNVETVTVRAYKVDLETYFRKMHLARGVESLDIALIDPDKTFEFKIPDYAKYQELQSTVEIPLPTGEPEEDGGGGEGPPFPGGVMAVTVSSEQFETTTMVIQSDLDVIVKSSRDEVFVFAENMRTGKPWPGVRLLISDGGKVIAEAATGEDGVLRTSTKPEAGQAKPQVLLKLAADGTVRLSGEDVPPAELEARLKALRQESAAGDKDVAAPMVVIQADPQSQAGAVQQLIQRCQKAGFEKFSLRTPKADPTAKPAGDQPPASAGRAELPLFALGDAEDIRVFAVAAGHVASNVVGLEGVDVAQGLSDKGYIYTDRPAYRAGGLVHVRGCLRRAAGDAYAIDGGKQYTLEVFDNRNRLLRQEEVTLSEFGSFHVRFVLPETCPQGKYRVLVRDAGSKSYQGTFQVHEYRLQPVRLVVDTPRSVYYRGEQIEGTIRAEYYYGAPLAGREVRYRLIDGDPEETGRRHSALTDEKGEVHFKLPTREYRETQVLSLAVELPRQNLQTSANFVLASRGFSIEVSSVRPVYVSGETFEATVKAVDAEGKPAARKLKLKVLEKTTVDGKVGEKLVEQHELKTAEADGTARRTLKLSSSTGGRYVLRAEGVDRFGNPVSGQHVVQVSGEEDDVRLRILADRHTYKVGETAAVSLHWRQQPALALVTFEGARVLDYKLMELKTGPNQLEIPMAARLAPNFELAVAVMTDPRPAEADQKADQKADAKPPKRFHTASSPFTVQRDLRVTITHKAATVGRADGPADAHPPAPGEDLEVTITTTDPQGTPVAAEVSLAMVEQSLLERFPWRVAAIEDFFRGRRRKPEFRTTSSITFAYSPSTAAIDPQLLAEQQRMRIAREEAASLGRLGGGGQSPFAISVIPVADRLVASGDVDMRLAAAKSHDPFADDPPLVYPTADVWRELNARRKAETEDPGAEESAVDPDDPFGAEPEAVPFSADPFDVSKVMDRLNVPRQEAQVAGFGGRAYAASDAADFDQRLAPQGSLLVELHGNGVMQAARLPDAARRDPKLAAALAAELAKQGTLLLPGLPTQETGYWNPAVVTGPDGKATVKFTLPERSTAWKLVAKGITTQTLAGEATGELVVGKDLFGQLKLPPAFTDGDRTEVGVAVHNDLVEKGQIEVVLKTTIAGRTVQQKKTIDVDGKGVHELVFGAQLTRPPQTPDAKAADAKPKTEPGDRLSAVFELTVSGGGRRDIVRRAVPIRPYGAPVFATAGGTATADTTVWVEPPQGVPLHSPRLQIVVGPTVEQSLMDIVLAPTPWQGIGAGRIAAGMEATTSDLMASLALQGLLAKTPDAGGPRAAELDRRIRSSIALLVSSQIDNGGFSWTGRGDQSNRHSTARAVWAMGLAREAGYLVPENTWQKALACLRSQMAATEGSDYRTKAALLHALATAGEGDFALANRLYRSRPALSDGALAYLALAFAEMDRRPTAKELLDLLAKRIAGENGDAPSTDDEGGLPLPQTELQALYALALGRVAPQAPELKPLVDWLLTHRTGSRFSPDRATGPAAMALCRWFAASRFETDSYKLAVFVNDVQVAQLDVDPAAGTQTIEVPSQRLAPANHLAPGDSPGGKSGDSPGAPNSAPGDSTGAKYAPDPKLGRQRINFQITGRGRYTYQCILSGFVPAERLQSTTTAWQVKRTYRPAPLEVDGREIPRGFGLLRTAPVGFENRLTQLPVGRRGLVELGVGRTNVTINKPQRRLPYLVVTEPIPCGATVIDNSVRGGFEWFEISPGAITFYLGNRHTIDTIHYELHGYLPGSYRAGPTVARDAHRPDQLAVSGPKSLTVLPQGATGTDPYRLTPRELYELGVLHFKKGDLKAAEKHLAELLQKWDLDAKTYKHAVQMLLDVHLELGPPAGVVRCFEIVKEKWPDEEIPFAQTLKVGAAYHEMGEYERSYLIFRATVQNSFLKESGVAGFLESQGEFARSIDVMGRLLREYPPEAYIAAATYALAQRVHAKAPEAASDEKLLREKINRVDLVRRASEMLESFLTAYPEDPAADQAAFSKASTLLELKAYQQAADACGRYARRYPDSELLDTFWYVIGYCHFAAGRHPEALEMCRKVADARPIDRKTGRPGQSRNKWQAVYIMGQVYHSLGRAADAVRQYQRVDDRFADAAKSIRYFLRKAIELPEVTTVRPGEAVEVELKFRNIAACDVKVYRIDLMKFSLMQRSLGGITRINLSGIRPHHQAAVELGDGKDYRDRTHKLPLPLAKEGAYLVVCRGDHLHASGLVLLTPLAVEVEEDLQAGQVRTTVKDRLTDRYLSGVHVKVIGAYDRQFTSGATDLRGVFAADGIEGPATVIARAESGSYAFYRSKLTEAQQQRELFEVVRRGMAGQTGPRKTGDSAAVFLTGPGADASQEKILAALDSPTMVSFNEAPLEDVVDYLERLHRIPMELDTRALGDVGLGTDTPITKSLKGVSLRSALRLMLNEFELTYVIDNQTLLITTKEQGESEEHMDTKAYPVRDLITFRDESGEEWRDFDSLIELITATVAPTTWDEVGGAGSIAELDSKLCLVVSQTQDVHEEIDKVLTMMRSIDSGEGEDGKPPVRKRPPPGAGRRSRGFGGMGMGGFGGGMGMGTFGGLPAERAGSPDAGSADLLKGLQDTHNQFQGRQVEQLQKMYKSGFGMGGVTPGAMF